MLAQAAICEGFVGNSSPNGFTEFVMAGGQWPIFAGRTCPCDIGTAQTFELIAGGTAIYSDDYSYDPGGEIIGGAGCFTYTVPINGVSVGGTIDTYASGLEARNLAYATIILQSGCGTIQPCVPSSDLVIVNTNFPVPDWGWWQLNENSGTTAYDSTANANDFTLQASSWAPGAFSGTVGLSFNGDTQYGECFDLLHNMQAKFNGTFPQIRMNVQGNTPWSISAWIQTQYGYNQCIFSTESQPLSAGMTFSLNDGQLDVLMQNADGSGLESRGTSYINDGNWHFVTATYDGSGNNDGIQFYVDGESDGSNNVQDSSVGPLYNTTIFLGTADVNGDYPFWGVLQDVRLFSYELMDSQVDSLYSSGPQ